MKTAVSRVEVAEAVRAAFHKGAAHRTRIVEAAIESGARSEVISTVSRLPEGNYGRLNDLWIELVDIPIEV